MLHNITSHKTKHKPLLYVTWHNMRQLNWYNVTNRNKTSSEKKQQNAIVLPTQHNHNTSRSRNLFVLQEKHYLSWAVGITRAAGGGGAVRASSGLERPAQDGLRNQGDRTARVLASALGLPWRWWCFGWGTYTLLGHLNFLPIFLGGFGRRFKNSQNNMILKWLIL